MLKINMQTEQKTKLDIEMSKELEKQLKEYLAVGKHFKTIHRKAKLNDLIVAALTDLVESKDYAAKAEQFRAEKAEAKAKAAKKKANS